MTSQRPFFSSFLAIFRTHAPPLPTAAAASSTSAQSLWTAASRHAGADRPVTSPRPITTKASPYGGAAAATTAAQDRQLQSPLSPLQHNVSPQTHLPRTPSTGNLPVYGPANKPTTSYPTLHETRRSRRGSDSSSDSGGFREVRSGGERWYIGGITASGEEKYYKLGMVKRERSADRISTDQLSL